MALNKQIHYGKLIRRQVTLVSIEMFPYFLKLGQERQLGKTAERILKYLRDSGKTSTTDLRKELGFQEKEQRREFLRAIDELQIAFAIAIVKREKAPRYTYTYDLMERWMPKSIFEKAKVITTEDAREKIISKMLENAVITKPQQSGRFIRF
ncbi:MAG: DNA glycosylase AlkZ-like family protein [Candidatus Hodarchaeota archaeon]